MRRSRSATAETRARIVSAASTLFLDEGLAAVGMRDVMAAASLTQGGFYRHFHSKEQLIAEANGVAFHRLFAMLETEIAGKTPAEAVETIVSLYLGQLQSPANACLCPLAKLGAELSHCDREVRAVAMAGHRRLVQLLADRLTHLDKPEAFTAANGVVSTMAGAVMLASIAQDPVEARAILGDAHALCRARLAAP